MKQLFSWSVFVVLILASVSVYAQKQTPFQRMDTDGDRRISEKEFLGPPHVFDRKDANHDGYLTPQEMREDTPGLQDNDAAMAAFNQKQATRKKLLYVDTHNHIIERKASTKATQTALDAMNANGIKLNFIMPMPQGIAQKNRLYIDDLMPIAKQYPHRIALLGGGGSLNVMIQEALDEGRVTEEMKETFDDTAAQLIEMGVVGFGEMTAEHLSMREDHPYVAAPPDHLLFLRLADLAARYNVPIDIHMDAVTEELPLPARFASPPNPSYLEENISGFERLLEHNRQAKIVWVHLGWDNTSMRTVELTKELLRRHPNLYMSIRVVGGMQARNMTRATFPLGPDGKIKSDWLAMLEEFPGRFVIGSDEIIHSGNSHPSAGSIAATVGFLEQLPNDVRKKIGYENAYKIYKINRNE